jgi:alkylation response protein AidB-like acyl-CoA dehydrogenase
MRHLLTKQQEVRHEEFKAFVSLNVEPFAEQWDREQLIPDSVLSLLAKEGYFGSLLPSDNGGKGWDVVTFGLLSEAFGKGSSALTDYLTVQAMVCMSLLKWGTPEQRRKWLPSSGHGKDRRRLCSN